MRHPADVWGRAAANPADSASSSACARASGTPGVSCASTDFEEVIRENLDIGRPDQMQLIFDRRVSRRTPGRFRTRVLRLPPGRLLDPECAFRIPPAGPWVLMTCNTPSRISFHGIEEEVQAYRLNMA